MVNYLNQLNGYVNDDVSTFSGGINAYTDKAFIEANQMPYCMNMSMYKPPMLTTRASRESILQSRLAFEVKALWAYNDELVFAITDGKTSAIITAYYVSYTGEQYTHPLGTIPKSSNYNFCYCRQATTEYLYIVTDATKARVTIDIDAVLPENKVKDYTVISDNHYGVPAFHKGRLFFANKDTNRIEFSALYDFDNFVEMPNMENPEYANVDITLVDGSSSGPPMHSGAFNTNDHVITLNGQEIAPNNTTFYYDVTERVFTFQTGNRLVYKQNTLSQNYEWLYEMQDYSSYAGDFLVTNSKGHITSIVSFDSKLVIFCEHSIHILYGDTPLTNSSSQFQLVDFNNNLGCIAPRTIAIGGGYLFWLGDDGDVYSYSGSSIDDVSLPMKSRYVTRLGGIRNIPLLTSKFYEEDLSVSIVDESNNEEIEGTPNPENDPIIIMNQACATATSNKYYIHYPIDYEPVLPETVQVASPVFVYDIQGKTWWAEDGDITAICNISYGSNKVLMARKKDIFATTNRYDGHDDLWTGVGLVKKKIPIKYEFHTKVYGADGIDSRKSVDKVWFQAAANADVFLTDSWTATNYWQGPYLSNTLKKIGTLERKGRNAGAPNGIYMDQYDDFLYEQQQCIVPKMYGQRLNAYQIVVRGEGPSKFYLMKRDWDAR